MGKDLKGKSIGKGICQRKDGVYQAKISNLGKPIYLYSSSLSELRRKRKDVLLKQANGVNINQINQTVDSWFENWMNLYVVGKLKPTTIRNYIAAYNRAKKYIGLVKISDATANNIQGMLKGLAREGYSDVTLRSTLTVISLMFEKAVASRLVLGNPCKGVVVSKTANFNPREKGEKNGRCLSEKDIEQFFDICKNARYYELYYILLNTGMRIGEACALEWKDIDFEKKVIRIYKTLNRTKVYYTQNGEKIDFPKEEILITTPKKAASYRDIPMTEGVVSAFHSWQKKQKEDKKKMGKEWSRNNPLISKYPGLVFTTKTGNCYLPLYAEKECQRIASAMNKREGLAAANEKRQARKIEVYPHLFRHTFTTHCYEAGMDPASIMMIVGHAHIEMLEHYTRLNANYIENEFNKFAMHKYA